MTSITRGKEGWPPEGSQATETAGAPGCQDVHQPSGPPACAIDDTAH